MSLRDIFPLTKGNLIQDDTFMKISWIGKHFGEEPPLVGNSKQGAGGIFFAGCNLKCVYCQNFQISQEFQKLSKEKVKEYSPKDLADEFLNLQKLDAVNIDLVSPTIWWKEVLATINIAKEKGLTIPIVWNSNGYENIEILRKFEGLVDIYLPDFKYAYDALAQRYSNAPGYHQKAIDAISEMLGQVGYLTLDENGVAKKGLVIRHLILPNHVENSLKILEDIRKNFGKNIHVSVMSQFNPLFHSSDYPELTRPISQEEFETVYAKLDELELENGWVQDIESRELFIPDFEREEPFLQNQKSNLKNQNDN